MELHYIAIITCGALAGGFVNGLVGFGTALMALGIWLYALSPTAAASLVIVCSVVSHVQTIPKSIKVIDINHVAPFIIPGLIAVPLGTMLLSHVDVVLFKLAIGCFLVIFAVLSLMKRTANHYKSSSTIANGIIGFIGGALGGLAGLSGAIPAVWADMHGWTKEKKRSTFQAFNLSILFAALLSHLWSGLISKEVLIASALALPGTVIGASLGAKLYKGLPEVRFKQIVLLLLLTSGCTLVITNL